MAQALEISQANYHKIESDKNQKLDVNMLVHVAQILDVDIKELLPEPFQVHIENQNNSTHGNGILINQGNEELIKSKDEIIRLQKEKILLLENEIERIKGLSQ